MNLSHIEPLTSPTTQVAVSDISWQLLQKNDQLLPLRALDSHKGDHGHVQVIGGDYGYAGAALMASQAALVSGAGLVSCATRPEHIGAYITRSPEIMASGINSGLELLPFIATEQNQNKVLVIGPGLAQQAFGQLLLQTVLQQIEQPSIRSRAMVLDADGLNLLAAKPLITGSVVDFSNHDVIITPHPAEAGRLLNISTVEVQADRLHAVIALAEKYHCTVILKGQHSLIAGRNAAAELVCYRCLDGNPGMASGGMGDILSGIIGAVLAQFKALGLSPLSAAKLACCVHSKAADDASLNGGEIGLLATDLLPYIRQAIQSHAELSDLENKQDD
ncbi:MAG: NAD(P)H-hydrate dehydratase [Oleispira sp.]|nr:NAD(P)H-hydrate dehydratase [Oleispira sp.]